MAARHLGCEPTSSGKQIYSLNCKIPTIADEPYAGKIQPKKPSGFSRKPIQSGNLRAAAWDHPALLSILRFKEPVLPLLRLVRRVSCRSTANRLEKTVLGRLMETVLQNE